MTALSRRRLSTALSIAALTAAIAAPSGSALAADLALQGWPGWGPAESFGPTGFGEDYPYFAGYTAKTTGPTTVRSTMPVVDAGSCEEESLVAGTVSIFDAALNVAAVYVTTECWASRPLYSLWLVAQDGTFIHKTTDVAPGDSFDVSITVSEDETNLEATNVTQGWTESLDAPTLEVARLGVGAVTGRDGAGQRLPIPDFGTMPFGATTVNGEALGLLHPRSLDLRANTGPRMTTSRIHDGTDFTVTFRHS